MQHLDGNVLAGPLTELFGRDMTLATGRCSGCGNVTVLARALVYPDAPGFTVRCCICSDVLFTLVQGDAGDAGDEGDAGDQRMWLDLRGLTGLQPPR